MAGNICSYSPITNLSIKTLNDKFSTIHNYLCYVSGNLGGSLPAQGGNASKFLQTDGTNLSWQTGGAGNTLQILTDNPVTTWDYSLGNCAEWTIGGNNTLAVTNVPSGAPSFGILKMIQGTGGGFIPLLPNNFSDVIFRLNQGDVNLIGFYYDGATFYWSSSYSVSKVGSGGFDPDAQAFFSATGIIDGVQQGAINQLVLSLKSGNIWTKMNAIYPFIGGTATTNSFNLKDPTQYRILWTGSLTHSLGGVQADIISPPSTSTGFGRTQLNPSTVLTLDSAHLSVYRTDNNDYSNVYLMGNYDGASDLMALQSKNGTSAKGYIGTTNLATGTVSDSLGLHLISRTNSTSLTIYKNATSIGINTTADTTAYVNLDIDIFGLGVTGGISLNTPAILAFATIGSGLSGSEVTSLYNSIQAYQTTLGRQV